MHTHGNGNIRRLNTFDFNKGEFIPLPAILEVQNLKKTYRLGKVAVPALRGVSFDVKQGEFLTIFGPSGSGKSTLLHLLGCLTNPDEGRVTIDGQDVSKMNPNAISELRLRKISFVFQFFNLLPRISALRNVEMPLQIAGVSDKETTARAKEMLQLVGLGHRANHRPVEMSGGEQQRVAIARALINNPKIVLEDEPTGNLDTKTGREIMELMKHLNEEKGQTFVVITHDHEIASMSDRLIYLRDGLIEEIKTPEDGRAIY